MEGESQFQLFREWQQDYQINFNFAQNIPKDHKETTEVIDNQQKKSFEASSSNFRALNPAQLFKYLPQAQREGYSNMAMNDKKFFGIRKFFGLGQECVEYQEFFGNLDPLLFKKQNLLGMEKLFHQGQGSHQSQLALNLKELSERISEIQKKTFNSINFNKTIGHAFYDHFQNFLFLQNESSFITDLESSLKNFIYSAKKIKGPSIELILSIYQYWMRLFRDFVNQIWKHSEKFTLNFFKKEKQQDKSDKNSEDFSSDIKGSNSSQITGQKQKRKQWCTKQIEILNLMIQSNTIFSNTKLKELSEEFNRTTSSISSKIQKLIKQKKFEEGQNRYGEMSLLSKLTEMLKNYPQGLNKDQVIAKISESYEMGSDQNWKKSITQLLSSSKQILKRKGTFRISSIQRIPISQLKTTFKDRVIQCLIKCPNYEADLKSITQNYLDLYGLIQGYHIHDEYKIRNLQASISKTLCRYEIFDKTKSRTLYFYNDESMSQQINVQNFIT